MKNIIFWSVGLYTIDIVVACGDLPDIKFPSDFTDGFISNYIKKKYDYDSRIEGRVFKIYVGIDIKVFEYIKTTMEEIADGCKYSQTRIKNVDDLITGGKTVIQVTQEMYDTID